MAKTTRKIFPIKLPHRRYFEFTVAAELQGRSRAGYLHPLIVKLIREERDKNPTRFDEMVDALIQQERGAPLKPAGEVEEEYS